MVIDIIKSKKISKVYLINPSKEIHSFFIQNEAKLSIKIFLLNKKYELSAKKIINQKFFISIFITLLKEITKLRIYRNISKLSSDKIVISYSPPIKKVNKGFYSEYYHEISNLLNSDFNWLFIDVSKFQIINNNYKSLKHKYYLNFLDSYLNIKDFIELIPTYLIERRKLNSIDSKNLFILNDINFYHIFKYDLLKSNSKVLIDTMIFERKLSNFFRINTQIREILYLLEYQPWEMVLNKVVSKKKIKTKGILFSIFRPNLFQFYHSKLIHPYMYNPNYIGVNSPSAKKIFNQNGFKNSQILKIEAQRYTYLDSLKNINCNSNNQKIIDSIIIATSIDPLETLKLLEIFAFSKIQFKKIYIREHPHLRVNSIIKSLNVKFPKYELINGSLYENFNLTDIVYCANSSSILFDSIFSSKHTITLITLTSIPNLAIKKADNLYFIYNSKNLNCILNNIKFKYIDKNKSKKNVKDLYLSNNNKNWLNFLNK